MSLDDRKAAQRALVHARLAKVDRPQASAQICYHLKRVCLGTGVLAYAPMRSEADVEPMLRGWLAAGLTVCVPRVDWDAGTMSAARIDDVDRDLVLGAHGVREPRAGCADVALEALSLVLVPGVAFDAAGGRLGRGGGFYDRLLGRVRARSVGVAFRAQLVDEVVTGAQDVRVEALVTETGWVLGG